MAFYLKNTDKKWPIRTLGECRVYLMVLTVVDISYGIYLRLTFGYQRLNEETWINSIKLWSDKKKKNVLGGYSYIRLGVTSYYQRLI
jgi:hypothetical protein